MQYVEQCPTLNIKDYKRLCSTHRGTTESHYVTTTTGFEGVLHFESMPCHFGGRRWFFVCPRCNTKRTILRGVDTDLMCNDCTGLSNRTAQVSHRKRAEIRRARLLKQLGSSGCDKIVFPDHFKPEGMSWEKYNRLRDEYHVLLKDEVKWFTKVFTVAGQDSVYDANDLAVIAASTKRYQALDLEE